MPSRQALTAAQRPVIAGQLRAEYERGATVQQLADGRRASYGLVHKLLAEAGTTMRRRGPGHTTTTAPTPRRAL